MEINATIEKIDYQAFLNETLQIFDLKRFDINTMPTTCLINDNNTSFAISKWVSPKRTRSYPYERVYNSLGISKKITVIPVVKDEGRDGDRDYIQWDTVSLMSLLDVFVIFAYYTKAEKSGSKITNQQFDNQYITAKIEEIKHCHSSALHWNLGELKTNFNTILEQVKENYTKIEIKTGVKLHDLKGLERFRKKIDKDVDSFKTFSREKAEQAQAREVVTTQPKEALSSLTKAKITITNYLGGAYYFTVDEVAIVDNVLQLIEAKHSKNALLPTKSDIKDGLLKLILYCNFAVSSINGKQYKTLPILKLTSTQLKGSLISSESKEGIDTFFEQNEFTTSQQSLVTTLFVEAQKNNFLVIIQYAL